MEDRNWMYRRGIGGRLNEKFAEGVEEFLNFAYMNPLFIDGDKIRCPCIKCRNGKFGVRREVCEHLFRKGFVPNYFVWDSHGERHTHLGVRKGDYIYRKAKKVDEGYKSNFTSKHGPTLDMNVHDDPVLFAESCESVNSRGFNYSQRWLKRTKRGSSSIGLPSSSTGLPYLKSLMEELSRKREEMQRRDEMQRMEMERRNEIHRMEMQQLREQMAEMAKQMTLFTSRGPPPSE